MPLSLALLFLTVLIDVRIHKIPNVILVFLVILQIYSVIFSYTTIDGTFAFREFGSRCLTVLFIFLFLFVFFSIGGLGGGDLKLLVVLLLGIDKPVEFVALVFIAASIISIIHMLINHNFYERFAVLWDYLWMVLKEGRIIPYYSSKPHIDERLRHSIHLSIPIFISYFILSFYGVGTV